MGERDGKKGRIMGEKKKRNKRERMGGSKCPRNKFLVTTLIGGKVDLDSVGMLTTQFGRRASHSGRVETGTEAGSCCRGTVGL